MCAAFCACPLRPLIPPPALCLSPQVAEKNERHFSEAQLADARNAVSVLNLGRCGCQWCISKFKWPILWTKHP